MSRTFVDISQAAKLLGISVKQFRRAADLAEVRPFELGAGKIQKYLWTTASLEASKSRILSFVNARQEYKRGASLCGNKPHGKKV